MKIYIKPSCFNKLKLSPLKKETLLIALFKGNTGLSGKGFVYE